jgi:hypothetical protein
MTGESDGASPYNAELGPALPQALAAEPLAWKQARRDCPMPPPLSSQEQMALVPISLENVYIHPHFLDYASQKTKE